MVGSSFQVKNPNATSSCGCGNSFCVSVRFERGAGPSGCDEGLATWERVQLSVRKRTGNLLAWLEQAKPDVVVLQEIKAQEPQFPRLEVEAAGYKVETVGQKGFNGVAMLSQHPVEITARALPDAVADEPRPLHRRPHRDAQGTA